MCVVTANSCVTMLFTTNSSIYLHGGDGDGVDRLGEESGRVFIFTIAVSKGAPWGRFQHQHLSQRAGSRYGFHLRLPPNAISCHQKYPHLRLHQQSSMRPQQVWIPELSVITSSSSLLTTSPPSGRRWSSWFGASGEHPQPWRSLRSCK